MRITKWLRGPLAVLVLALALASCEHAESPMEPDRTEAPDEFLGLGDWFGGNDGEVVRARDLDGDIEKFTLVEEQGLLWSLLGGLRLSEIIGFEGGSISLLGHTLTVPVGAVDQPTLFVLAPLSDGTIRVELIALQLDLFGLLDIGSLGFDEPVEVELSYERETNVDWNDEDDLVILRLNPRGMDYVHEVMPSEVDRRNETVRTDLEHFSAYCMAM